MFNNHNHSEFSNAQLGFADSTNKLTKLIQTAYDIGLDGIALTDHEGIQGHIKAWKYYQSMDKDRDFKLALGNEIYLMTEQQYLENQNPKGQYTPYYHFILTALDTTGHRQIRELSNRAWQRATAIKGFMRKPTYYVDIEEIIGVNKGHVIGSTACLGSLLDKLILNYKLNNDQSCKQEIHKFIQWGLQTFGKGNFYLEIQPCNEDNIEQRTVNTMMWTLSQAYDIPIIPTTDSHYLIKEHSFIHKTLLQSKDGDREVDAFYATTYLMSDKELREYLRLDFTDEQIDIMFNYSMSIHNRVQDYELKHAPVIPEIPDEYIPDFQIQHIFKEWYDKYPYFKYYATEATYIHDRYFFYRIEQGLQNKIVDKGLDIKTYIQRCDTEFKELKDLSESFHSSMASYYSTFKNIIDIIWDSDSLSMPARGSVAAYLISYLLDITQIDPVPLGDYMPYWRHLSKERGDSIPDIDNDSQASKREVILENIKKYFGYDKVLSVSTYNTLTAKTAIERSVKGLHLNDELAGYLKSLVPVERGNIWSINDCLYGDGDTRKPIKLFIEEVEQYEHLKECLIELEGLVVNRGIHASGVIITNDPYVNYISAMRSPKGVICTSYDLHDCEYCGVVKVDLLTVQAADKIRATLDLLIKYGEIEWQGNIKKTYWKYIHPDVLEYNDSKMWEIIKKIYSVFQFDTAISVQALNRTEPHSVMDLSAANSLLRLQTSGNEQPLDTYVRYKNDINEWRNDCVAYGLTEEEMEVLKEYLSDSYMLADSQEKVMRLSMDKRVANFGLTEANLLRKGIAKKDATAREKSRKQFYEKGLEQGTRQEFLDYIWNDVFSKSFGYSFSQIHSYSYSIIALQEINLNYFYPPVYWNCACLTVESNSFDNEDSSTKKNTDYGKMTTAIYKMKSYGIDIQPPSINRSDISFTPLVKENQILFGLGGIAGINHDIAQEVIDNRPYESFDDFYNKFNTENKTLVTHSKIINLIKAGCFDEFGNREEIFKYYLDLKYPPVSTLNTQKLSLCIKLKVNLPQDLVRIYRFKQYVCSKQFFYKKDEQFKNKKHYIVEPTYALPFLREHWIDKLTEDKDYYYDDNNFIIIDKSLEKVLKSDIDKLKQYLKTPKVIKEFNDLYKTSIYQEYLKDDTIDKWSFETTSYYHFNHELSNINYYNYNLSGFLSLPANPRFIVKSYNNRIWRQYELSRICGTVVDRDDSKHIVYLLTPDNVIVNVKFVAEQYSWYKQTISVIENDKRTIIDDSWFKRGTLIMVTGYRQDDNFRVKRYKHSVLQHSVAKIIKINNGTVDLQTERMEQED